MFTGLVDDVGVITGVAPTAAGREVEMSCGYDDLVVGESVSCNGACLTVTDCGPRRFRVAAIATTLGRTTIGSWEPGRRVNLERAMRADGRFGGHIVLGHVDGVGTVRAATTHGDAHLIDIEVPPEVAALLIPHGSITVDGVSLTVNALPAPAVFQVSIIAHTLRTTNLGALRAGDAVHLESDVIGKYVQRLLGGSPPAGPAPYRSAFD
jgi:riboflavin synthase